MVLHRLSHLHPLKAKKRLGFRDRKRTHSLEQVLGLSVYIMPLSLTSNLIKKFLSLSKNQYM